MKKVMTGVLIAAAVGIGGTGAAAAQSVQQEGDVRQDCRTYSSVTECGTPRLDQKQQKCVTAAVEQGMTERRAAVECRAFG